MCMLFLADIEIHRNFHFLWHEKLTSFMCILSSLISLFVFIATKILAAKHSCLHVSSTQGVSILYNWESMSWDATLVNMID